MGGVFVPTTLIRMQVFAPDLRPIVVFGTLVARIIIRSTSISASVHAFMATNAHTSPLQTKRQIPAYR